MYKMDKNKMERQLLLLKLIGTLGHSFSGHESAPEPPELMLP